MLRTDKTRIIVIPLHGVTSSRRILVLPPVNSLFFWFHDIESILDMKLRMVATQLNIDNDANLRFFSVPDGLLERADWSNAQEAQCNATQNVL